MLVAALVGLALGAPHATAGPQIAPEGCGAFNPGSPGCTYTAAAHGGIGGYGAAPAGWTVTIERAGEPVPVVIRSAGGFETYACGAIEPGDVVTAAANPGSGVTVGNPGICF
jgi:hypothetical protein